MIVYVQQLLITVVQKLHQGVSRKPGCIFLPVRSGGGFGVLFPAGRSGGVSFRTSKKKWNKTNSCAYI